MIPSSNLDADQYLDESQQEFLANLTMFGRHLGSIAQGECVMLIQRIQTRNSRVDYETSELLSILRKTIEQHLYMIISSIEARKKIFSDLGQDIYHPNLNKSEADYLTFLASYSWYFVQMENSISDMLKIRLQNQTPPLDNLTLESMFMLSKTIKQHFDLISPNIKNREII